MFAKMFQNPIRQPVLIDYYHYFVVAAFFTLAAAQHQHSIQTTAPTRSCNQSSEFHCELEDRCIPLDWRCDFVDQCLDGQDELHCSPQWCDFDQGLCHWSNDIAGQYQDVNGGGATTAPGRPNVWRRYFPLIGSGNYNNNNNYLNSTGLHGGRQLDHRDHRQHQNKRVGVAQALANLSNELDDQFGRFVFVPMRFPSRRVDLSSKSASGHPESPTWMMTKRSARFKTPAIGRTNSRCQLRFKYSIALRPSGQLVDWLMKHNNNNNNYNNRAFESDESRDSGPEARTQPDLIFRGNLTLWATKTAGPSGDNSTHSWPLWSRSADYHLVGGDDNNDDDDDDDFGPHWTVGVAEVGQLSQTELSFEARAELLSFNSVAVVEPMGARGRVKRESANNGWPIMDETSGHRQPAEPDFGLFAFRWFRFHDCQWPQSGTRYPVNLEYLDDDEDCNYQANKDLENRARILDTRYGDDGHEDDVQEEEDSEITCGRVDCSDLSELINNNNNNNEEDEDKDKGEGNNSCLPNEFECPKNGICLADEQLCNFVDDCMLFGQATESSSTSSSSAVDYHNHRLLSEGDEAQKLCANIVNGMEDFERLVGDGQANKLASFWWVNYGNWPQDNIRVLNTSSRAKAHQHQRGYLPSHDHTSRLTTHGAAVAGGNFLSLEAPQLGAAHDHHQHHQHQAPMPATVVGPSGETPAARQSIDANGSSNNTKASFWASLESPWLVKLANWDCRVKLFVNLVSPLQQHHYQPDNLPYRVHLMIEHLTIANLMSKKQSNGASENNNNNIDSGSGGDTDKRQATLDFSGHSHRLTTTTTTTTTDDDHDDGGSFGAADASRSQPIEYPGVDFWRPINAKLVHLSEGDVFRARIIVHLEERPRYYAGSRDTMNAKQLRDQTPRLTVNLDDLSTHFGCRPLNLSEENRLLLEILDNETRALFLAMNKTNIDATNRPAFDFNYKSHIELDGATSRQQPKHSGGGVSTPKTAPVVSNRRNKWHYNYRFEEGQRGPQASGQPQADGSGGGGQQGPLSNPIEPQKLIVYVLGVVCSIVGLIALIVFVLVPYVERVMMNYQEQIQLGLSAEVSDVPIAGHSSLGGGGPGGLSGLSGFSSGSGGSSGGDRLSSVGHRRLATSLSSGQLNFHQHQHWRPLSATMTSSTPPPTTITTTATSLNGIGGGGGPNWRPTIWDAHQSPQLDSSYLDSELYHHKLEFMRSRMASNSNSSLANLMLSTTTAGSSSSTPHLAASRDNSSPMVDSDRDQLLNTTSQF